MRVVTIAVSSLIATLASKALAKNNVNILTWWGYIAKDSPAFKNIEKECNTAISIDEFYSSAEFLKRLSAGQSSQAPYDIAIFSDTMREASAALINRNKNLKIAVDTSNYVAPIKNYFQSQNFARNTAIFQISLTGFLWNKKNISLSSSDTLGTVFTRTQDGLVVLVDDHVEISTLLRAWECSSRKDKCQNLAGEFFPSEQQLRTLLGNSKLLITSDLGKIDAHPKFALAYTWSGDAIARAGDNINLEFLLHPSLSHTSMDLVSLLGKSKEAACVSKHLASQNFLTATAQNTLYFSPYGPVPSKNEKFNTLQRDFFESFSKLKRIHRVTLSESAKINEKWQVFKLQFGNPL
jgi:hypothetical protein